MYQLLSIGAKCVLPYTERQNVNNVSVKSERINRLKCTCLLMNTTKVYFKQNDTGLRFQKHSIISRFKKSIKQPHWAKHWSSVL